MTPPGLVSIKSKLAFIMAEKDIRGKEMAIKVAIAEANKEQVRERRFAFLIWKPFAKLWIVQVGELLVYIKDESKTRNG